MFTLRETEHLLINRKCENEESSEQYQRFSKYFSMTIKTHELAAQSTLFSRFKKHRISAEFPQNKAVNPHLDSLLSDYHGVIMFFANVLILDGAGLFVYLHR